MAPRGPRTSQNQSHPKLGPLFLEIQKALGPTVASKITTPDKNIYFESIRRGEIYYAVVFLPRIVVLELIMQGDSAACYVEKPRLGASGVKHDARKFHQNSFTAG